MSEDRVVELRHPGSFSEDPLTSVLRSGAQRLLAQAVEMEVTAFIAAHCYLEDDAGRRRVVRHGHHRERQVQTGIGPVAVRCPSALKAPTTAGIVEGGPAVEDATAIETADLTLTPKSGPGGSSPMRPERWSCPSWPVPASGSRCSSGAVVGYRRSRCTRIAQPWPRAG